MLKHLFSTAAVIGSLALLPVSAHAAEITKPCRVLIQFYNEGPPGSPGITADNRYGVRLDIPDVGRIVLPSDSNGYVVFYVAPGTIVPYSYSRLTYDPLGDEFGVAGETGCGFTAIQVPAGN